MTMLDELDAQLEGMLRESGGPLTPAEIRQADEALLTDASTTSVNPATPHS